MPKFALLSLVFILATTTAGATPWTYTDQDGNEQNTDACPYQDCRGTERDPVRPRPGKPIQIPGDKSPPNLVADKSDKEPPVSTYNGHWCLTPVIVSTQHPQGARHPACVDCGSDRSKWPARPKTLRSCSSIVHAKGKMVGQW